MKEKIKYAPPEIWEEILKYVPIPTVDLVLEYGDQGIIFVRRKIEPYKGKWALPGLRFLKGEDFNDAILRIARQELGLQVNPEEKTLLGVYTAKFRTAQGRQDISTGFYLPVSSDQEIRFNKEHFSGVRVTQEIPSNMGAMYKYYISLHQELKGE